MPRTRVLHALGFAAFFSWTAWALAAPQPASVSGPARHGRPLTVDGAGFGAKAVAAPLAWDDLESGRFSTAWRSVRGLDVNADHNRHPRSKYNGHKNFDASSQFGFVEGHDVYPRWFCQYWFMVSTNWDWGNTLPDGDRAWLSNIKMFRMWNPSDKIDENFVFSIQGWENQVVYNMEYTDADPSGSYTLFQTKSAMTKGRWHLMQFEYAENSALKAPDGQFRFWFDGQDMGGRTNIVTREDFAEFKRPGVLGFHCVWAPNYKKGESAREPNDFYLDDIYMDNTWARVELGNNPSYEDCLVREIQIPIAWSERSIRFTVNQGALPPGTTAYLFVTDASGARNATGIPVTIAK
ncbi:MAG: hypothetical protein JO317_03460 [Verrucomicrobiae bacterium]|nr:hypothetical protein [Verrucomicrobiae bacterium]